MVVKFARSPSFLGAGGATSSSSSFSGKYLSPYSLEEGGTLPTSPSKRSFLEYYYHLDLEQYRSDTRRGSGCMASAWRVISFFVVVFVLPTILISLPLYARYHLYHARHIPMTETDTRALNHAVSSFWCQGQRVTSNGTLDAFLVAGSPRVQEQRRNVTLRRNLTLQHDDIEYWGVYLLQGSTVALASSARWPGGVLLVVQGEENLRKCFYRENRLENQLNGDQSPGLNNVYKSPPNQDDMRMEEEHHWEDGGGEVFDDETERKGGSKDKETEIDHLEQDDDIDDLVPVLSVDTKMHEHKYHLGKPPGAPKRKNQRGKKNKKGKKGRHFKTNAHHRHSRKNQAGERVRRDAPESSIRRNVPTQTQMMDILRKFNDTIDVTTGNSSFSSSEEFLEQCRDSILTIDISPYTDWENHISNLNANNPDSWRFAVNTSDYYYFIFTSDNSIELNYLGFNLELQRATYDVSSAIETCRNSTECVFPLAFTQTEAVVVEVPAGENLQELHSFEVTTTCQPRVPVYMVFILLVPFIILLFAFQ